MSSLFFESPASEWLERLPLGNGALGVMCDGGVAVGGFALNDETAWSGSPLSEGRQPAPDAEESRRLLAEARAAIDSGDPARAEDALRGMQSDYSQAYLPLGSLRVIRADVGSVTDAASSYRRRLDMSTGVHEVSTDRASGPAFLERAFVSAEAGVLVIDSNTDAPRVELDSPHVEVVRERIGSDVVLGVRLPSDVAPGHEPQLPAAVWSDEPGAALHAAIVARVISWRSGASAGSAVLLATSTTFDGLGLPIVRTLSDAIDDARGRLDRAESVGVTALLDAHSRDISRLMSRAGIRIPASSTEALPTDRRLAEAGASPAGPLAADPGLVELLFDYGRYLLVSSSRSGGLPATLQGIWNDSMRPPWSSNYTININTQMNYWGAEVTSLSALAEPMTRFVLALADAGRATAALLYDAPGWVAHHNSDAWLFSRMAGVRRADTRWAFWPMAAPWLVRHLWDAVEFGAGRDHAEAVWPAIRGAAEFAIHWQHRATEDDPWRTSPATSPENAFLEAGGAPRSVDSSTAMDDALLLDLYRTVDRAADMLDLDRDPVVVEARQRLAQLRTEPELTADGLVREWSRDRQEEDPHHRHVSHLYGLYPGRAGWSAEARAAAARTMERRGDDSAGWSLVWKTLLWARLGRGDKVSDLLRIFLRPAGSTSGQWAGGLYPNLFAAHPPFQIDGNLGIVGAIAEALLQSHDGIELLPALPAELPEGEAYGLIARPGISVDLTWAAGVLQTATLLATSDSAVGGHSIRWRGIPIEIDLAVGRPHILTLADFPQEG